MLKIKMTPHPSRIIGGKNGIARVVEAYAKHLPNYGIEFVGPKTDDEDCDLLVVHAGGAGPNCDVCHCHGLYWTADYDSPDWAFRTNKHVIDAARNARIVTVPSEWVARTFRRDMRMSPSIVPHGIEWDEWQHDDENKGYILWNKNRSRDVCDTGPLEQLARQFPDHQFVTTFSNIKLPNIHITGTVEPEKMKQLIQSCSIYLATTKETFGIGTLEAMASGKPVLGYDQGGTAELVKHNDSGYLAQVGNVPDLFDGLVYCTKHADALGANGRELARNWPWQIVAKSVADIYEQALHVQDPTVAIIIPSFNYANMVSTALTSATSQTYDQIVDIIVVNDGSTDDTDKVMAEWVQKDERIRYIKQPNMGVAVARNRGILETNAKYIVCLDADDWIDPSFVSSLIPSLEQDRSLGVAYTRLTIHRGEKERENRWPNEYTYDDQVRGINQVPTCCAFRREAWARLGGYRQRYAPEGCGSEDAEFWLRMGSIGYNGKMVSDKYSFHYTMGGHTTNNRENTGYTEPDWLAWHPWTRDEQHPFASVATPKQHSHPVRQYDTSMVSVVIPVGSGHLPHLMDCLDSLESQSFRQWEAIVVLDIDPDPGQARAIDRLKKAYPYVQWITSPCQGSGYARNRGAEQASAPFLLFLDADDIILPEALEAMLNAYAQVGFETAIYSASIGTRTVSPEQAEDYQRKGELLEYSERNNVATVFQKTADYNHSMAIMQPQTPPYFWCYISTLHPTRWWTEVGGFDESIPSWEDWDYWMKIAKHGYTFTAVHEPLIVYNYDSGNRREDGQKIKADLLQYLTEKHKGIEIMACRGCSKSAATPPPAPTRYPVVRSTTVPVTTSVKGNDVQDENFVLVQYVRPKRGSHPLAGVAMFPHAVDGVKMRRNGGSWVIDYGYHTQNDVFYIHVADLEQLGMWFVKQEPNIQRSVTLPTRRETAKIVPTSRMATIATAPIAAVMPPVAPVEPAPPAVPQTETFDLQILPGISARTVTGLALLGIHTPDAIVEAGSRVLQTINGIGKVKANAIVAGATEYMNAIQSASQPRTVEEEMTALAQVL